jgi:hypothetical protein
MVDALRFAHRLLPPGGFVLDLHPTASNVTVEVGASVTGFVDLGGGLRRHAAAARALTRSVATHLFTVERTLTFDFFTYGDSIDELRDYIAENWREARIGNAAVERARDALRDAPGVRPRVREHVQVTRLLSAKLIH